MVNRPAAVEVPTHDLHRLLLAFRDAIAAGATPGGWTHMADWDKSFERLADILDAQRQRDGFPVDRRLRCQHTSAYNWPAVTGPARWVCTRSPRERHLVMPDKYRRLRGLCGFQFAEEDTVKRPRVAYRACDVCEREQRLQDVAITE